jgi:hypothetical protein
MSENITHTAIVDDGLRLLTAADSFCPAFKDAAREHLEMAQLGCMTRSGDRCNPGLLATFRERWQARSPADRLEPKLAFVLGWLCHRAADRQMKPIFRRFHPPQTRTESPTECSIYHDAHVFHEVYANGAEPPYHPAMFGSAFEVLAGAVQVTQIEHLLQVLLRRVLIQMHTLIPDLEDAETWIDSLYTTKQDFYVKLIRYDQAITHPDPEKVRLYITEDNFYDRDDAIIHVARRLQHGEDIPSAEVDAAIATGGNSQYAQALATAVRYLQAASDFFVNHTDEKNLKLQLDIGKPGRDGEAV